jgi:hypothetical protein
VRCAQDLADDFAIPAQFACGSFIPPGGESCLKPGWDFAWLTTEETGAYETLGVAPDDMQVIFAYPWPDEEFLIETLFERFSAVGAFLLTWNGEEFLLRQKQ